MENMETFIYSKFCILIKPKQIGLVKFFQKCAVWVKAILAKNSKSGKRSESDKVVISILLQLFTGASD
jgi:hypothetical protein